MSEFTNVTVIKKANIYFDGKVVSRTVVFADGSKQTLGSCSQVSTSSAPATKNSWKSSAVGWTLLSPAPPAPGQ